MKNRSFAAQCLSGVVFAVIALIVSGCGQDLYPHPEYPFANRSIPPSQLLYRVMASYSSNGTTGGLEILDGQRDLRSNVQNTIPAFFISGYSGGNPATIINYPEQQTGFVLSTTDGRFTTISYGKETTGGDAATFGSGVTSVAASPDGSRIVGSLEASGQLAVIANGSSYLLNLPNVYKVAMNRGGTVMLAMTRNTNSLYRVIKLDSTITPTTPPGAVDCQPALLPVYCVVPVAGTYDRPTDVVFSRDGNTAYVLNCGPECGGVTSGITFLNEGALTVDIIPKVNPLGAGAPSPLASIPGANPLPVPGGVTAVLSDGSTLYISGQSLFSLTGSGALGTTPRADGLFTGYLTTLNLSTYALSNPISISDGKHTKMLFADDKTLWIGAQQCANGERQATGQNYNCLTRVQLGGSALTAGIFPAVTPGGTAKVPYPNTNQDPYYYGSLTGLCWVENNHKIYTAYGGQIHAFNTADGSEINNFNITVQGTVLDVAFIDASTNDTN